MVIVLYKILPENSSTIQSMLKFKHLWTKFKPQVLIYNNYSESYIESTADYEVVNAKQNDMLAGAYNYTLNIANKQNIPWLVLFDQDTEMTANYITELQDLVSLYASETTGIDIIIPRLFAKNIQLSPCEYNPKWFHALTDSPLAKQTICEKSMLAFNSGIVLRCSAINKIGGFSYKFPLDCQDHNYMYRLYKNKSKGYVMRRQDLCTNSQCKITQVCLIKDINQYWTGKIILQKIADGQALYHTRCGCFCVQPNGFLLQIKGRLYGKQLNAFLCFR